MMAALRKPLAEDFDIWYSQYSTSWKPQRLVRGAVRSDRQHTKLPTPLSPKDKLAIFRGLDKCRTSSPPTIPLLASVDSHLDCRSTSTDSSTQSSSSTSFLSPSLDNPTLGALFTTEYYEARPSKKGGLGALATKHIPEGTTILKEEPLVLCNLTDIYYEYERLSTEDRKKYRSLHGWRGINSECIMSIFQTNRFSIGSKSGIFYKISRFNHACHPASTCTYKWSDEEKKLAVTTLRDIQPGEEITISYGPAASLYDKYGFYCDCEFCPNPEQAFLEAEMLKKPGSWTQPSHNLWR